MPRHLISDAHEWINEIPSVPISYLAEFQPSLWERFGSVKCILLADLNPQRPERSPIRRILHKYLKKALGMNYRLRLVHTHGHLDSGHLDGHSIQQIRL